ncbi:MAG: substrate-binding domain-containing protein [Acidimicrobiales bacterium]
MRLPVRADRLRAVVVHGHDHGDRRLRRTREATVPDWVICGSTRLVAQLADGARADLLITADEATMQTALDTGVVDHVLGVVAGNRLVLAVAPGNPGNVAGIDDLADPGRLVGVCAAEVPCGRLARAATSTLGVDLRPDTEEPDVRSLALKVSQGELDAGLVYRTDARALGLVTVDDDRLAPFVRLPSGHGGRYALGALHVPPVGPRPDPARSRRVHRPVSPPPRPRLRRPSSCRLRSA